MLDIVMRIEKLPEPGADIYADSQTMTVGGCAYNAADILKHFQVPFTLFAPVGSGIYADIVRDKLSQAGHVSAIHSKKCDNGYCLCLVEKGGERTFITLPGIECGFEREWFDGLRTEEYDSVYVSGYEIEGGGGEEILKFLECHPELTVYYGPGPRIACIEEKKQERMFACRPIVHLNEKEAVEYTGMKDAQEAAGALSARTGRPVIITLGPEGAYLYDGGQGKLIRSVRSEAVDTTGAGDAHIGAVIAARKKGYTLERAVAAANRVSAKVVSVKGPSLSKEEFNQISLEEEE